MAKVKELLDANEMFDDDDVVATCAICGKEVTPYNKHWTSGECSIDWDWGNDAKRDALLENAQEELAAKGFGGTTASPVVLVKQ
jgi:hypothetical protein